MTQHHAAEQRMVCQRTRPALAKAAGRLRADFLHRAQPQLTRQRGNAGIQRRDLARQSRTIVPDRIAIEFGMRLLDGQGRFDQPIQ
jgi:hypothetical protein